VPTPVRIIVAPLVAVWLAVAPPTAHGQWWWPQPRASGAAPWQPELFSDYLASGQPPHPAVPRIVAAERDGASLGSGVLVDANGAQGLVLTNWHVVRDTRSAVLVQFPDGFQSAGTVIQQDETWDLAVIVVWRPPAAPVPLADTPPAIGEPLTIAGWGRGTFRAQTGPCTQYLSPGSGQPQELVELWATARQGDSGGPILDARGRLAGVLFGQNEGRTIGSCCTRLRAILARVGSVGVPLALASAVPAPRQPLPGPPGPWGTVSAAVPPGLAPPGETTPSATPLTNPTDPSRADSVAVAASPTAGAADAGPLARGAASGGGIDLGTVLDRLRTPAGRETALQVAGGLALAILGLRTVFAGRGRG